MNIKYRMKIYSRFKLKKASINENWKVFLAKNISENLGISLNENQFTFSCSFIDSFDGLFP